MKQVMLMTLAADPDNVKDLSTDPAYTDVLTHMRKALRDRMLAVRDTAFMPESLMAELAGAQSPTVVSSDNSSYPLAEILDFIDAYQFKMSSGNVNMQIQIALKHRLAVMRYWGVIAAMETATTSEFIAGLSDQNETVRLAAAEAAIRTGAAVPQGWREVVAALAPKRSRSLRLQAANIVADYPSPPAEAVAALGKLPALQENQNFAEDFAGLWEIAIGKQPKGLPATP